jgi:hypothetical protein
VLLYCHIAEGLQLGRFLTKDRGFLRLGPRYPHRHLKSQIRPRMTKSDAADHKNLTQTYLSIEGKRLGPMSNLIVTILPVNCVGAIGPPLRLGGVSRLGCFQVRSVLVAA